MDAIQIIVESESNNLNIRSKINGCEVPLVVKDNILEIKLDLAKGINTLTLISESNDVVKITDIVLNNVSARQSLYLAYTNNKSNTWLTHESKEIHIPFGNPMGWWLGEVINKIPNKMFGKNLYESFDIYYPEPVKLANIHPLLIKEFIETNFGFHVVPKNTDLLSPDRPWTKINIEYDQDGIKQELDDNLNSIREENPQGDNWQVCYLTTPEGINPILNKLPKIQTLINDLKGMGIKIMHSFVGTVDNNNYVYPHADDFYKHDERYEGMSGCQQFFFPIGWKHGNYFKFQNVGFVPYDQGALLINPGNFAHGSVNTSGEMRFTLGMYCDLTEDNIRDLAWISKT